MANSLGLPIISEGVENESQQAFLEARGCRYAQGFLFYEPMNPDDFESVVSNGVPLDTRGFQAT